MSYLTEYFIYGVQYHTIDTIVILIVSTIYIKLYIFIVAPIE